MLNGEPSSSRSLSTGSAAVRFSPVMTPGTLARLTTQLARSSSDLGHENVDETQRRQRGSICSSTSDDRISSVFVVAQQKHQQERQKRRASRANATVNNNRPAGQTSSFSSRGSTSSHVQSSASSSLVGLGGRELQLVSQCRACQQDYREIGIPKV